MVIAKEIESGRVFAGIVVKRKKEKIVLGESVLLVRRKYSDSWELPGGKIEPEDFSIFYVLQRELWEELGIYFPLEMLEGNDICTVRSDSPRIKEVDFVVKITVTEDNDPGLIKLFKEGLPFHSEIEEVLLVDKNDLSTLKFR